MPREDHFSGKKAAEIVGISYRQLDYWARTDLIRPSVTEAAGSGSRRRYSYRDLLELKIIKTLLDAGLKLEMVREVFSYIRNQLGTDVASANLVINGHRSVVVQDGGELHRHPQGRAGSAEHPAALGGQGRGRCCDRRAPPGSGRTLTSIGSSPTVPARHRPERLSRVRIADADVSCTLGRLQPGPS